MRVLELDRKSQMDLMLLAQSGPVGRARANKTLWGICSYWALRDGTYPDLSNKVSNMVNRARMEFDRPPRGHDDLRWWRWKYLELHKEGMARWGPDAPMPAGDWEVVRGDGEAPLEPPYCYRERTDWRGA